MQNMADANANNTDEYVASPSGDASLCRDTSSADDDDDVDVDADADVDVDVDVVGQAADFEIVGLFSLANGCSC
jgi:hypothetical protein